MVQGQAWADGAAKTDAQEIWEAQGGGARGSPVRTRAGPLKNEERNVSRCQGRGLLEGLSYFTKSPSPRANGWYLGKGKMGETRALESGMGDSEKRRS